jgi:TPR repeat protein
MCYAKGTGVAQDWAQAVFWWEKAAAEGNVASQAMLGESFAFGKGVTQDMTQAVHWFEKVAATGNEHAQLRLSMLRAKMAAGGAATARLQRASE